MRSNTPRRKEIMRCTTCLLKLHKKCNKELSAFFIYFILFKLTIINQIISYNNQCRAALDITTSLLALLLCVISTYYCCCCLSYLLTSAAAVEYLIYLQVLQLCVISSSDSASDISFKQF